MCVVLQETKSRDIRKAKDYLNKTVKIYQATAEQ